MDYVIDIQQIKAVEPFLATAQQDSEIHTLQPIDLGLVTAKDSQVFFQIED